MKIKDCRSCPFKHLHYGHGECWYYCSHPDHNRDSYEDILFGKNENPEDFVIPGWCPLKEGSTLVKLDEDGAKEAKYLITDDMDKDTIALLDQRAIAEIGGHMAIKKFRFAYFDMQGKYYTHIAAYSDTELKKRGWIKAGKEVIVRNIK